MQVEMNDKIVSKIDLAPLKSLKGGDERGEMKKDIVYEVGGLIPGYSGIEIQVVKDGQVVGFLPLTIIAQKDSMVKVMKEKK